jgi:hypothetical protein
MEVEVVKKCLAGEAGRHGGVLGNVPRRCAEYQLASRGLGPGQRTDPAAIDTQQHALRGMVHDGQRKVAPSRVEQSGAVGTIGPENRVTNFAPGSGGPRHHPTGLAVRTLTAGAVASWDCVLAGSGQPYALGQPTESL